jgi:hypothetical protein
VSPRGPKRGAGVSGGPEVGKLGGRPPATATLRVGGRIVVQRGDGAPLEEFTVVSITRSRGLRTVELHRADGGALLRIIIDPQIRNE